MIKPGTEGSGEFTTVNSHRLYGCQSNVVYGRSQLLDGILSSDISKFSFVHLLYILFLTCKFIALIGLPPLVLRRILEIMTYLATNHSAVANILFDFDRSLLRDSLGPKYLETQNDKGKEKIVEGKDLTNYVGSSQEGDIPLILFLKLLSRPLFLRSIAHLEQVGLSSF